MKRINRLKIANFKAFINEETIEFDGKNVLIYGGNGSGKSSLYWTLYTFLQSSSKKNIADVQRYFDITKEENLRNINASDTAPSFIELELIDTDSEIKHTYTISQTVVNTQDATDTDIKDANQASDFINYRLLLNFYHSAHSEEIELFWVFRRDILPYFNTPTNDNFGDLYKRVSEYTPEKRKNNEKVRRSVAKLGSLTIRTINKKYADELTKFNDDLEAFILELIQPANDFLNVNFLNNQSTLRLTLDMPNSASYDVKKDLFEPPSIRMKVEQLKEDGTYETIHRPHSFLNEARLTQIALSVRLAAMLYRPTGNDLFKFLVLDDMLISLDMDNRMSVVKTLLNDENFKDFQQIILTHDKSFFNLIKSKTLSQDWKYFEFYKDENPGSHPQIINAKTELEKAKEFFEDREYEACANYLRKSAEIFLTNFLDPEMKEINRDFESLGNKIGEAINKVGDDGYKKFKQTFLRPSLTDSEMGEIGNDFENNATIPANIKGKLRGLKRDAFRFIIEQNQQQQTAREILHDLKDIKDRILNPLSHGGATPLYHQELKDAIAVIEALRTFLNSPDSNGYRPALKA